MKRVIYRRMPEKQPKAVAVARTAPGIPVSALFAAGVLTVLASLALRGLL